MWRFLRCLSRNGGQLVFTDTNTRSQLECKVTPWPICQQLKPEVTQSRQQKNTEWKRNVIIAERDGVNCDQMFSDFIHQLGHLEKYVWSLHKIVFTGSSFPKQVRSFKKQKHWYNSERACWKTQNFVWMKDATPCRWPLWLHMCSPSTASSLLEDRWTAFLSRLVASCTVNNMSKQNKLSSGYHDPKIKCYIIRGYALRVDLMATSERCTNTPRYNGLSV